MRVFGRKEQERSSTASRDEHDWRSYDLVAEDYARTQAPALAVPASDLVELLQLGTESRVLDVGAGTGGSTRAVASKVGPDALIVGVDPSVEMLRRAEREGGGPSYAAATSIDLPFRDASFTHVVANFVITHFPKYDTAFYDVLRVLRRGGRMGVTTWGPSDARDEFRLAWRGVAEEFAGKAILADATKRALPWEDLFADKDTLKEVLYQAGLRDISVEQRDYRFEMSTEEYLIGRETTALGRFLHHMLGERLWETFSTRIRDVFAERFPSRMNDFREVILAVGRKP